MSEKRISRRSPGAPRKAIDWTKFAATTEEDIRASVESDPDVAPLVDKSWFESANFVEPAGKVPVTIRLDREIVEFFKQAGGRYQTRINAVLRAYVEHEKAKRPA